MHTHLFTLNTFLFSSHMDALNSVCIYMHKRKSNHYSMHLCMRKKKINFIYLFSNLVLHVKGRFAFNDVEMHEIQCAYARVKIKSNNKSVCM